MSTSAQPQTTSHLALMKLLGTVATKTKKIMTLKEKLCAQIQARIVEYSAPIQH